jgi:DNA (cytosine-5)-methyltransferase 1
MSNLSHNRKDVTLSSNECWIFPIGGKDKMKNSVSTCIDLFSGCGGLSLGLEQAGFHPLLSCEINPSAAETYIANRSHLDFFPVADIYNLTDRDLGHLLKYWDYKAGVKDVDLVCGGPPCQGYSGIGHRRTFKLSKEEIPSNHLYQEMIRVVSKIKPKIFLFENVRGLLTSRWSPEGVKGEIFREVLGAFQKINGYIVKWDMVFAKDYGVPQNRPRVLMVGIREDIFSGYKCKNETLFAEGSISALEEGFLPLPYGKPPGIKELLSDLVDPKYPKGSSDFYFSNAQNETQEKLRTTQSGKLMCKGDPLLDHVYSSHSEHIVKKFAHMIKNDGEIPDEFKTKKFAQRVLPETWDKKGPNITATSLADDFVHYSQPRSLTVREWARIQGFPDWYIFRGPRTTGGRRRAGDPSVDNWDREVPKYTQIGNAVPVELGRKLGLHFLKILNGTTDANP